MSGVQSIKSWFKPITREEIELQNLLLFQESRHHVEEVGRISAEAIQYIANNNVAITDLIDENIGPVMLVDLTEETDEVVIVSNNSKNDENEVTTVGDNVFKAFDNMVSPLAIHSNNEPSYSSNVKRLKRKRPANWRTIADYFKFFRNVVATVKHFELLAVHESIAHWGTTLGRWLKDYNANKITCQYGREAVYGTFIDIKLSDIV